MERNQLLISYVEPHKLVVSCTIAGWLVRLLKEASIDTDEFRAHLTRGASTSTAQAMGLSCSEILEAARWSKITTRKTLAKGCPKILCQKCLPNDSFVLTLNIHDYIL